MPEREFGPDAPWPADPTTTMEAPTEHPLRPIKPDVSAMAITLGGKFFKLVPLKSTKRGTFIHPCYIYNRSGITNNHINL